MTSTVYEEPATFEYTLKVTLDYTKPPVWRRIVVPDNFTLQLLHRTIQVAMGWGNDHLHGFSDRKVGRFYKETTIISKVFKAQLKKKVTYEYDFGDSWRHTILLEKVNPYNPSKSYPQCIGGRRACPPEDCGGVPGYHLLVYRLNKQRNLIAHKEGKPEVKAEAEKGDTESDDEQWDLEELMAPIDYDPAHFDCKEVEFHDLYHWFDDMSSPSIGNEIQEDEL